MKVMKKCAEANSDIPRRLYLRFPSYELLGAAFHSVIRLGRKLLTYVCVSKRKSSTSDYFQNAPVRECAEIDTSHK